MKDEDKSREQLAKELFELRQYLKVVESAYNEYVLVLNKLHSFEKALETMQLGVTITDLEGRILYINNTDAMMHGYTVDELRDKNVNIFSVSARREIMDPEKLKNMKRWKRDSENRRKDGTKFPVHLMSDVVTDADGNPVGIVTTCEDITQRKKMEKELKDKVVELEKFYEMSVGRELKMKELKNEIKKLKLLTTANSSN